MDRLLVLDCETTGIDPEMARVVEVAGVSLERSRKTWKIDKAFSSLINPEVPIPPEAQAIHHISSRDVARAPRLDEYWAKYVAPFRPYVPVAHNAAFDSQFMRGDDLWICTWRCARHVWPDCPSHSNQCLRYWLGLFQEPEDRAMPPHRAPADAWVTAHVALRLLKSYDVDRLREMTDAPILLRTVHFGKHRGEEWRNVPRDYLRWILSKPSGEFDRDVEHTARHYCG